MDELYQVAKGPYIIGGLKTEAAEYNLRKMVDILEYGVDESKQEGKRSTDARTTVRNTA